MKPKCAASLPITSFFTSAARFISGTLPATKMAKAAKNAATNQPSPQSRIATRYTNSASPAKPPPMMIRRNKLRLPPPSLLALQPRPDFLGVELAQLEELRPRRGGYVGGGVGGVSFAGTSAVIDISRIGGFADELHRPRPATPGYNGLSERLTPRPTKWGEAATSAFSGCCGEGAASMLPQAPVSPPGSCRRAAHHSSSLK